MNKLIYGAILRRESPVSNRQVSESWRVRLIGPEDRVTDSDLRLECLDCVVQVRV